MSKAADDYDNIAKRLKEIEAEKLQALTGEQPKPEVVGEAAQGWPYALCGM